MSAHGGTIGRVPLHVPIRPVVAIVTAAAAIALTLGAVEANRQPARDANIGAEFDWSPTTGHPAIRDRFGNERTNPDHDRPFDSIIKRKS